MVPNQTGKQSRQPDPVTGQWAKGKAIVARGDDPRKPRRVVKPTGKTGCKAARGAPWLRSRRATGDVVDV